LPDKRTINEPINGASNYGTTKRPKVRGEITTAAKEADPKRCFRYEQGKGTEEGKV